MKDCGQKFQTRRDLDKHLKTHVGVEKTYKYVIVKTVLKDEILLTVKTMLSEKILLPYVVREHFHYTCIITD